MRRAKIVATIGPALDDVDRLRAAIEAGIDVARLNFSHGSAEINADRLEKVRKCAWQVGRPVGSLGDLQGPKIRLGTLPGEGVELADGGDVVLVADADRLDDYDDGTGTPVLPVPYAGLVDDLEPGAMVLMDDGLLRLVVSRIDAPEVHCRIIAGGTAQTRKGINLPGVAVSARCLTDKDRQDVKTMVDLEIDWIALSFVRKPDDVEDLRKHIESCGGEQPIVSKLERPEVVDNLDDLIQASDAVMVARGDLGVEIGPERVPTMQKEIIAVANSAGRPVITATEMLESMIRNPRPTRAEASDVANAVFDGTDALMLSGETASGRYPVEAVRTMARIIEVSEGSRHLAHPPQPVSTDMTIDRTVAKAAVQAAEDVQARALVVFSLTGASVVLVSKFRPEVPIIGLTPNERSLRRLSLLWGTTGQLVPERDHTRDLIEMAEQVCLRGSYGERGDAVVVVSGIPGGHGGTNRVLVHRLGEAYGD